ncbi:hypothetical protein NDU88_002436, partial [Pleurodeles waltl]
VSTINCNTYYIRGCWKPCNFNTSKCTLTGRPQFDESEMVLNFNFVRQSVP